MAQELGFDWYNDGSTGIERLTSRVDESRRSASWFIHRLPAQTELMRDLSADPVISLEFDPSGAIQRAVEGRSERAVLNVDTLTLTPALMVCEWNWEGAPLDIMDVYIPQELLQIAYSEHCRGDPALINLEPTLTLQDAGLIWLMRSMLSCSIGDNASNNIFFETMTMHLVLYLLRLEPSATTLSYRSSGAMPMASLRRVKQYIEENLSSELSLEKLASVAGISRFHFARQFRGVVGETPHRYLVRRRLERARQMLVDSRLPVTEIAMSCGFSDPSHFAKRFRREYRLGPSDFRRINI